MTEAQAEAQWTEDDQAYADFVSDLACEISENEDVVYLVIGALEERGLFDAAAARASVLAKAQAGKGST